VVHEIRSSLWRKPLLPSSRDRSAPIRRRRSRVRDNGRRGRSRLRHGRARGCGRCGSIGFEEIIGEGSGVMALEGIGGVVGLGGSVGCCGGGRSGSRREVESRNDQSRTSLVWKRCRSFDKRIRTGSRWWFECCGQRLDVIEERKGRVSSSIPFRPKKGNVRRTVLPSQMIHTSLPVPRQRTMLVAMRVKVPVRGRRRRVSRSRRVDGVCRSLAA
jgi:hypothetical protein